MKNKYFILVLTFLSLLIGQSSYAQDWQDFDDDFGWEDSNDGWYGDDSNDYDYWNNDFGADVNGGTLNNVTVTNNYHEPDYSEYLNADLYDPYNHLNDPTPVNFEEPEEDPVVNPKTPATPDPEVCTLSVCTKTGYEVNTTLCACVPIPRYWYLDNDGDDYDGGSVYQGEKPTGNYKESTKGDDCDDNDARKYGNNCGLANWYLDNDGDGYDSGTYTAETSPGPNWKEGTSKGVDCDDSRYSDTNVCDPIDPCAEIKKQLADQEFKKMITDLKDPEKLKLNHETGYYQDKAGNYKPMEVFEGEPGVFVPYGSGGYQNINHVHQNQWVNPANGSVNTVLPMPSPRDIATIYTDYNVSRQSGTDPGNNYTGTINSLGYFQLRYTGQSDNLPFEQLKEKRDLIDTDENEGIFKALAKDPENGQIKALLLFMRDTLKITDIALYKVDETGAKKLELDANNQVKETPCN